MEPLRHIGNPNFGAVVFRRLSTNITSEGGLWDTSRSLYPDVGGEPGMAPRMHWKFPTGAKISFAHLQYDNDVNGWQGSQIPLLCFDEVNHFSEHQFFYMLSRNRSTCGVRPYVRATCNPDADSWVARLIAWWIDQDSGYPIPERAGVLRYFTRLGNEMIWGDTPEEVLKKAGRDDGGLAIEQVKSLTFIPSTLADNAILLKQDPSYKANLMALPRVERERLLGGNWKVRKTGGTYFPQAAARIIPAVPTDVTHWVRRWDLAATKPHEGNTSPDATCGVLMGKRPDGWVIADVKHMREDASEVRKAIQQTAARDRMQYRYVDIVIPQDPGQAGRDQAQSLTRLLAGYNVSTPRESGSKEVRAEAFAAQWQVGNVSLVEAPWNAQFLAEMDGFPDADHDDAPDASAGAFTHLTAAVSATARFRALAS